MMIAAAVDALEAFHRAGVPVDAFLEGMVVGLVLGIVSGLSLDTFVLRPLVRWHARTARHGER